MKIALVSLDQAWEDKQKNLHFCEVYIAKAAEKKVDLIIFPEMTLTGFSNNISKIAESREDSTTLQKFQSLAKQYHISIIFGLVIKVGEKAQNRSLFIDDTGEVKGEYAKIHPFSFAGEDQFYTAGDRLVTVNLQTVRIGLTICYDLRFPELYSALAKDCDLIVNIANWPAKRIDHWNTLLKARAIENQVYIAGVNRTGEDGNSLGYVESSGVYNANGETLSPDHEYQKMKIMTVNKAWSEEFKKTFITVKDRRLELYKQII